MGQRGGCVGGNTDVMVRMRQEGQNTKEKREEEFMTENRGREC